MSEAQRVATYIYLELLEQERNDLRATNTDLLGNIARLIAENVRLKAELEEQTERADNLEWQIGAHYGEEGVL